MGHGAWGMEYYPLCQLDVEKLRKEKVKNNLFCGKPFTFFLTPYNQESTVYRN